MKSVKAKKKPTLRVRACDLSGGALCTVTGAMWLFFTAVGLFSTCRIFIDRAGGNTERVLFEADSPVVRLLVLAVLFCLALWLTRARAGKKAVLLSALVMEAMVLLLGFWWIGAAKAVPGADSASVISAARAAAGGDVFYLARTDYYRIFPFQLGYTLYAEGFFRVFGANGERALACANVIFTALAYLASLLSVRLLTDGDTKAGVLTALLLSLCLQPVFLCTFLYGTLPGMAFALWGAYFVLRYARAGGTLAPAAAALCLAAAVTLKKNYTIVLIACCIVLLLKALRAKKAAPLLAALLMAGLAVLSPFLVQKNYEARAETRFGPGTPQTAWLAAGFDESSMCAGWFNSYTTSVLRDNGFDQAETKADIDALFRERVSLYAVRPRYTLSFFYQKIVSQWNEPAFQSVWSSEAGEHSETPAPLAQSIYDGPLERVLSAYFNDYTAFVYAAFALYLLLRLRTPGDDAGLLFPLVLFGSALYYALFEAKAQYALPCLPMLCACAAMGLSTLARRLWGNTKKKP